MNRNISWIILIFYLIINGCTENDKQSFIKFYRSEELYKVMELYSIDANHYYMIIIQDGMCNSCSIENIIELEKIISSCKEKDFIFINNEKYTLLSEFISSKKNTTLIKDSLNFVKQYGLRLSKDLIFEIKDNKIVYWNYVTEDNLPSISSYIKTNCL
ncbi:MAG: hypothetical protein KatS3mg035_1968 [Bacteroidia bacterium]|nr:MAG: hypothetical protein KatS3mg035_1968 [Bacteroidia bacterium]